MNYKDKHLIDQAAPDGFDLDKCPVYKAYIAKCNEDILKQQIKEQINGPVDDYYKTTK